MTKIRPSKKCIVRLYISLIVFSILWNSTLTSITIQLMKSNNNNAYNDIMNLIVPSIIPTQQEQQEQQNYSVGGIETSSKEDTSTTSSPPKTTTTTIHEQNHHKVAGLNCHKFQGGPYNEYSVQEMVYWKDIPMDTSYRSAYKRPQQEEQFLTFEPDKCGWNNVRMAMETVVTLAVAMGRTIVLPPERQMFSSTITETMMANKNNNATNHTGGSKPKYEFSFADFFHFESITKEHETLGSSSIKVITMDEFLKTQALTGKLVDNNDPREIAFPPHNNRTNWNGANRREEEELYRWLRQIATITIDNWHPDECIAVFPKVEDDAKKTNSTTTTSSDWLKKLDRKKEYKNWPTYEAYVGKPLPVDASPIDRLKEMWAERKRLCIYNEQYKNAPHIHIPIIGSKKRLLTHFYAYVFFEDWKLDLWMKRFVRDHMRYVDEIQCAAARVVHAIRKRVKHRQLQQQQQQQQAQSTEDMLNMVSGNDNDDMEDLSKYTFDTFHIRHGAFKNFFGVTQVDAKDILNISQSKLQPNGTIYIATDETNKTFFQPFLDANYDVVFLSDFMTELGDSVNVHYYGMIEQLIAARGLTFFGCWFSTFTGYINRLRGYHTSMDHTSQSYIDGIIPSWYYAVEDRYDHMQTYYPVKKQFYAREFPTAWRLIDTTTLDTSTKFVDDTTP